MLYHYRKIDSAVLELQGTFHFSAPEDLNDPVEGFVTVFFEGDRVAWRGLLRNYAVGLMEALTAFFAGFDDRDLRWMGVWTPLPDASTTPKARSLIRAAEAIGDDFMNCEACEALASALGEGKLRVSSKQLRQLLGLVHSEALNRVLEALAGRSEKEAGYFRPFIRPSRITAAHIETTVKAILTSEGSENKIPNLIEFTADYGEDMMEEAYFALGATDRIALMGHPGPGKRPCKREECDESCAPDVMEKCKVELEAHKEAAWRRRWIDVMLDYPRMFIESLPTLMYPRTGMVCFSKRWNNSAMWGNYADNHRGVCLGFEPVSEGEKLYLSIGDGNGRHGRYEVMPVDYGCSPIARNFFTTLGHCNGSRIQRWLSDGEKTSASYSAILQGGEPWRLRYWEDFRHKLLAKTPDWSGEQELRMVIDDSFYPLGDRNLRYDKAALKEVIFGMRTSEYDKYRVIRALQTHGFEPGAIRFTQIEYDDVNRELVRRKKYYHWNGNNVKKRPN